MSIQGHHRLGFLIFWSSLSLSVVLVIDWLFIFFLIAIIVIHSKSQFANERIKKDPCSSLADRSVIVYSMSIEGRKRRQKTPSRAKTDQASSVVSKIFREQSCRHYRSECWASIRTGSRVSWSSMSMDTEGTRSSDCTWENRWDQGCEVCHQSLGYVVQSTDRVWWEIMA